MMNTLCRARTHLLVRAITHAEARRYISIKDIQAARRKLQQQKDAEAAKAAEHVNYPPPPRTAQDIARDKRKELQRQKENANVPDTKAEENRLPVKHFDARAINTNAVALPSLTVVLSGETPEYKWSIQGHENQIVEIDILPGQSVVAETGAMLEMSDGVNMDTKARGGIMQSFKRMFTGQGLFLTEFTYNQNSGFGRTVFSSPYPSKILALDLQNLGGALICQKNAFLVGSKSIEIEVAFTKNFTSGFFGGEGFILQQLHGEGVAFVHAGGAVIKRELAPGETIRVSTGSIVAFQPSVDYDVQMVPGFKNMLFGGEGIFLATLTGPGLVILQSLPFDRLVGAITSRLPSRTSPGGMALPLPFVGGFGGSSSSPSSSGNQTSLEQQRQQQTAPATMGGGGGLGSAVAGGMAAGVVGSVVGSAIGHGLSGGGGAGAAGAAAGAGDAAGAAGAADNAGAVDDGGEFGEDAAQEQRYVDDQGSNDWAGDDGGGGDDWGDD